MESSDTKFAHSEFIFISQVWKSYGPYKVFGKMKHCLSQFHFNPIFTEHLSQIYKCRQFMLPPLSSFLVYLVSKSYGYRGIFPVCILQFCLLPFHLYTLVQKVVFHLPIKNPTFLAVSK